MSKKRRCPICAELVKADATKCRCCGSTLVVSGPVWDWKGDDAAAPGAAETADVPDVGLAGVAVVLGALAGFAVGAWLDPALHPVLVLVGAAAGGALAKLRPVA